MAKAREATDLEKKAGRLEAQLARECEKRQKWELELKRLQETVTEKLETGFEPIREDEFVSADKLKAKSESRSDDNAQVVDWRPCLTLN